MILAYDASRLKYLTVKRYKKIYLSEKTALNKEKLFYADAHALLQEYSICFWIT